VPGSVLDFGYSLYFILFYFTLFLFLFLFYFIYSFIYLFIYFILCYISVTYISLSYQTQQVQYSSSPAPVSTSLKHQCPVSRISLEELNHQDSLVFTHHSLFLILFYFYSYFYFCLTHSSLKY